MKKLFSVFLLITILLCPICSFAKNNVSEIGVTVTLSPDGTAYIVQNWKTDISEGTEFYLEMNNLNGQKIEDFKVSDINGEYKNIGRWNVDASFKDKANKCGIVTKSGGYELCWGISNYGENRYSIEYKVTGLVASYDDYDGFNFMFVNKGMSFFPTDAHVEILLKDGTALNKDNCGIWSFGYGGQIEFKDGKINAYTTSPLADDNSMIILASFNKGLLSPTRKVSGSFESVKEKAFEGSSYSQGKTELPSANPINSFRIIFFIIIASFLLLILFAIKRKIEIHKMYKNSEYFREIPMNKNLEAVYLMALNFGLNHDEGTIITGAYMQMILGGNLEPVTEISKGIFGSQKENISLKLVSPPESDDLLLSLYEILRNASGSDNIVEEKELKKYCEKHYDDMNDIVALAKDNAKDTFDRNGYFKGIGQRQIKNLTEGGKAALSEVMGFKKFLLDFSLIEERTVKEVAIWQEYLVFASVIGVAEEVKDQLKKLYPETVEFDNTFAMLYIAGRYNTASYAASIGAQRSSGAGGSASFGGGGGFSGGGGGGIR
ncbi:MAG: DUF2207 domain-containing protein [Bacillota bacterium]|nr:DUF2207 domain-containing protein [Bacillota bacterium]